MSLTTLYGYKLLNLEKNPKAWTILAQWTSMGFPPYSTIINLDVPTKIRNVSEEVVETFELTGFHMSVARKLYLKQTQNAKSSKSSIAESTPAEATPSSSSTDTKDDE